MSQLDKQFEAIFVKQLPEQFASFSDGINGTTGTPGLNYKTSDTGKYIARDKISISDFFTPKDAEAQYHDIVTGQARGLVVDKMTTKTQSDYIAMLARDTLAVNTSRIRALAFEASKRYKYAKAGGPIQNMILANVTSLINLG